MVYGPSLALNQGSSVNAIINNYLFTIHLTPIYLMNLVTAIDVYVWVLVTFVVCTFYTSLVKLI